MAEFKNILLSEITICVLVFVFLLLFFKGLFCKRKIEKEKDFITRVNKLFLLKYEIMLMLILGIVFVVVSYIFTFLFEDIGRYLLFISFVFLLVPVEWAFKFDKINIYINFSKYEIVKQYILYFAKNEISNIRYLEIITWFSRWNHKYFRVKSDNLQDADKIITKLELLLRPNESGLCLASHHKKDFLKLCTKIVDYNTNDILTEIENMAQKMEMNSSEKYRNISLRLDRNILIYLSIMALHITASILISDGIKNVIGNILFYIPSDILVILVYKGIIRDREEDKK